MWTLPLAIVSISISKAIGDGTETRSMEFPEDFLEVLYNELCKLEKKRGETEFHGVSCNILK